MTKVAVIGSRTFPLATAAGHLLDVVTLCRDRGDTVLVRGRRDIDNEVHAVEGVDHMVSVLCKALEVQCDIVSGLEYGPSRYWAFQRDKNLVDMADHIVAFYDPDRVGEGGTAHVIDIAVMLDKHVGAYTVDETGELVAIGEHG